MGNLSSSTCGHRPAAKLLSFLLQPLPGSSPLLPALRVTLSHAAASPWAPRGPLEPDLCEDWLRWQLWEPAQGAQISCELSWARRRCLRKRGAAEAGLGPPRKQVLSPRGLLGSLFPVGAQTRQAVLPAETNLVEETPKSSVPRGPLLRGGSWWQGRPWLSPPRLCHGVPVQVVVSRFQS